jgi:hypothetical protein
MVVAAKRRAQTNHRLLALSGASLVKPALEAETVADFVDISGDTPGATGWTIAVWICQAGKFLISSEAFQFSRDEDEDSCWWDIGVKRETGRV